MCSFFASWHGRSMFAKNFIPFQDYHFFWFGAFDKSFHFVLGLCVGMVARKSCVLLNFGSSSICLLLATICGSS